MKWVNFLHFYQPHNQQKDILNRIVHESYLPIVKGLLERPKARTVININGALVRLLADEGYDELLEGFRTLGKEGWAEFTGSAMYHAFLPLIPKEEIKRQIMLNDAANKEVLGNWYSPVGFFSPEMGINSRVLDVVSELGYKWIGASEVALPPEKKDLMGKSLFVDSNGDIDIFFRNKRVSSLILSASTRRAGKFLEETTDLWGSGVGENGHWFTVMDAETFGHHRIGHEKLLFDLLDDSQIESVLAKDLLGTNLSVEEVEIRPSTWTNSEQDFWLDKEHTKKTSGRSFILWRDPTNPIHKLQWDFVNYVLGLLKEKEETLDSATWDKARQLMDKALASDQFWWASTNPWWSLEMIEQGAFQLKMVAAVLCGFADSSGEVFTDKEQLPSEMTKAENYYRKILDQAFEWQRSGYIRQKHLDNSSTFMKKPFKERAPAEWYNQIALEFEDQMQKAADDRDFELAIKWRDALTKLRQGTDIYDVLHVVDELWSARSIPELKPFLEHDWSELSGFSKEQFRAFSGEVGELDKEGFEDWKKRRS
ncbi:hypothetical protein GF360_00030 [candidate division WWE3 bacterium]|nr:hypothetical protein [candidate division WWE3 bacterium]